MKGSEPVQVESAAAFFSDQDNLESLRRKSESCKGCPLWIHASQTVFGEGPAAARAVLVGEQPGDREDRVGRPFVGPAGRLLDSCLDEAGLDRRQIYLTNAVKHFKWIPNGARRLHQKPNRREVVACRPWLEAEIDRIAPEVVVCLGATAAQSLLGPDFRLTQHRGEFMTSAYQVPVLATIHPSAILRADEGSREVERASFVRDLKSVAQALLSGRFPQTASGPRSPTN